MTDAAALAKAAAQTLIDALWPEGDIARQLSCKEANTIAEFIGAVLGKTEADLFIQAHSVADEEGDEHVEMGKISRELGVGWSDEHTHS